MDPSVISLHEPERNKVTCGGGDHAGYAGDGFKEKDTGEPLLVRKDVSSLPEFLDGHGRMRGDLLVDITGDQVKESSG